MNQFLDVATDAADPGERALVVAQRRGHHRLPEVVRRGPLVRLIVEKRVERVAGRAILAAVSRALVEVQGKLSHGLGQHSNTGIGGRASKGAVRGDGDAGQAALNAEDRFQPRPRLRVRCIRRNRWRGFRLES